MWVKPHILICVEVLLFTGFSQSYGYFGEMDDYRDYLPCGSELPLEPDQKYFIRSERFGGNINTPMRRRPQLFKRQADGYYYGHGQGSGQGPQAAGNPRPLLPPAPQGGQHAQHAESFQNPAHADFKRKSCIWKFHGNGNCQLMVHFDKYSQGDPACIQQYVFVTDDDHEIQACENRILPPAFDAATKTITVKHYRSRRVGRLSEFEGYAICHSLDSGHAHREPIDRIAAEPAFARPVPVNFGNRGNFGNRNRGNSPPNYRPNYNRFQNPRQNPGQNSGQNGVMHNGTQNDPEGGPFQFESSDANQRRPSIRRLMIDTNSTVPTNTTSNETALPIPNMNGEHRPYNNYRNPIGIAQGPLHHQF